MLRAVLFDFDGVIADSEKAHFQTIQQALNERGVDISWQDYRDKYLGYNDLECFCQILSDKHLPDKGPLLDHLLERKKHLYAEHITNKTFIYPGVDKLLEELTQNHIYCAICSGALKAEINTILKADHLQRFFPVIIAAEDVSHSKPHPEGYNLARQRLNLSLAIKPPLKPEECVVVEDSIWGIEAAHSAGMPCLAIASNYHQDDLHTAEIIVSDINGITLALLQQTSASRHD